MSEETTEYVTVCLERRKPMKYFAVSNICLLIVAAVFLNVACNNQEKAPVQQDKEQVTTKPVPTKPDPLTPEQLAERAKTAERVKKAFEANYRIKKTPTGYSLAGLEFNDSSSNAMHGKDGWMFIINQKNRRTIEIAAPGVGTAKFKYDTSGNLEPLIE